MQELKKVTGWEIFLADYADSADVLRINLREKQKDLFLEFF